LNLKEVSKDDLIKYFDLQSRKPRYKPSQMYHTTF